MTAATAAATTVDATQQCGPGKDKVATILNNHIEQTKPHLSTASSAERAAHDQRAQREHKPHEQQGSPEPQAQARRTRRRQRRPRAAHSTKQLSRRSPQPANLRRSASGAHVERDARQPQDKPGSSLGHALLSHGHGF